MFLDKSICYPKFIFHMFDSFPIAATIIRTTPLNTTLTYIYTPTNLVTFLSKEETEIYISEQYLTIREFLDHIPKLHSVPNLKEYSLK